MAAWETAGLEIIHRREMQEPGDRPRSCTANAKAEGQDGGHAGRWPGSSVGRPRARDAARTQRDLATLAGPLLHADPSLDGAAFRGRSDDPVLSRVEFHGRD